MTYHLKELEESKPKVNKRKETIKFREDISKIDQQDNRKHQQNQERIKNINKSLARNTNKKRDNPNKIRNEQGEITTDTC